MPLRIPDYGRDRVLSDATRRQSTKESHLTQLVVHVVANSRSLSGMIGRQCKVARRMAQWVSSQDDEQQQGAGESNTPIKHNGPSSNNKIPHPLMDCGQGKNINNDNNDPATGRMLDEVCVGIDVASGKDGERTSDGEDDATGNDSVEDVPKAIAGVNYPIAGAPHPINMPLRLRTCESIPPPPHGATPPLGGSKSVRYSPPPPYGATPPSGGSKSVRLASPPPYSAIPPSSGTMTVN